MRSRGVDGAFIRRRDAALCSRTLTHPESGINTFVEPRLAALDHALEQDSRLPAGDDDTSAGQLEGTVVAAFPELAQWVDRGRAENAVKLLYKLALLVKKRRRLEPLRDPPWSAAALWPEICARTDELYELCESCQDHFVRVCRSLIRDGCGQKLFESGRYAGYMDGGLKDPVRTHEKALDDYAERFGDGVLPEACVTDMVRARVVFTEAAAFRKLYHVLQKGFREERDGTALRLELIRGKNKFRTLDPSHFRNILYNVILHIEWSEGGVKHTRRCICELQAHHLFILKLNDERHGQRHYEFFRRHLRNGYEVGLSSNLDFMLETRMRVFDELGAVPVLLSLLILCLRSQGAGDENARLPADMFELYSFAIAGVLKATLDGPQREACCRSMLRRIATANNLVQRRIFTLDDVRAALGGREAELAMWMELMRTGAIPLVKVLALLYPLPLQFECQRAFPLPAHSHATTPY